MIEATEDLKSDSVEEGWMNPIIDYLKNGKELGVQNLKVLLDSELVSGQVNKTFETKDQRMKLYCSKVIQLMKNFRRIDIQAIKRELNARADQLAKGAAYGEYDKKSKVTTASDLFPDVNMVEATEDLKSDSVE